MIELVRPFKDFYSRIFDVLNKDKIKVSVVVDFLNQQEAELNRDYMRRPDYEEAREKIISKLPISNGRDMDVIHAEVILKALGIKEPT